MIHRLLTQAMRVGLALTLGMLAVGCGSSGSSSYDSSSGGASSGGYTPPPPPPPPPAPAPEPEPEPPLAGSLQKVVTTLGGTYAGEGMATVLIYDADTDDFITDDQDRDGMTLYTFDNDPLHASVCDAPQCVTTWPPLLTQNAGELELPLSAVERGDGHFQVALRGMPLYFFANDSDPGDVQGHRFNDVWRTALLEPGGPGEADPVEGVFLVARGEVLTALPDNGDDSFSPEREDRHGFTLYTFTQDEPGVSNCAGQCLAFWPPLLADTGETAQPPWGIIQRALDGHESPVRQWTYQGMPLYFFANDQAPGDTNGTAVPNWQLARPQPWQVVDSPRGSALAAAGEVRVAGPDNGGETTQWQARHGFTLYTFDNDSPGSSNCTAECLSNWPALMAQAGAEAHPPYSLVERGSGDYQWALHGMPLYFFVGDGAPGAVNGDEVVDLWRIARDAPVTVHTHDQHGGIFVGWGNLVDVDGNPDTQRAGFSLYTFTQDTQGVSACTGACLDAWPPLYAPGDAADFGDFTVTERPDAGLQWAYRGQPLYFYQGDTQPGDTNGTAIPNWPLATP